ncbi:Fc.00g101550.m01.CDS01 [Cosmosporella sp. VM-42]
MPTSSEQAAEYPKQIVRNRQTPQQPVKPRFFNIRSWKWSIIFTVLLGIYVDIFLYGGTVVIIPFVLEEQIGIGSEDVLAWNSYCLIAYSVAAVISSPIAGYLADRAASRRQPLLWGLLFLLTGTLCLWLAKSGGVLLLGRVLQGISCGFVWSIGLALVADAVGDDGIGRVLGLADVSFCLGIASAPPVAGALLDGPGKHAVYGLAMGLIVLDVSMRVFIIEPKVASRWGLGAAGELKLLREYSPSSEIEEAEVDEVPYWKVLAKSWRIRGALCGTWAVAHILISIDATVPVYFEQRLGWHSSQVGFFLLSFYAPSLLCVYTGHLADKFGGKWPVIAGFLGCVSLFLGMSMVTYLPKHHIEMFMWTLMLCVGTSLSFANTPVMAEVIYAVIDKQGQYPSLRRNSGGYGLAYGMFMTVFSIGFVFFVSSDSSFSMDRREGPQRPDVFEEKSQGPLPWISECVLKLEI